jgi:cytochrome c-type biogenesis protein CcmE
MKTRYKRLMLVGAGLAMLGVSAWLVLGAFQKNLVFFFTPTQILAGETPHGRNFRVGGMVQSGSLVHEPDGLVWSFVVTDMAHTVNVRYRGILPDLFKEGKGVVAEGKLGAQNVFEADQVLAKHDENYMPPDAAYALKKGAEANRDSQHAAGNQSATKPAVQAATQNAGAR